MNILVRRRYFGLLCVHRTNIIHSERKTNKLILSGISMIFSTEKQKNNLIFDGAAPSTNQPTQHICSKINIIDSLDLK